MINNDNSIEFSQKIFNWALLNSFRSAERSSEHLRTISATFGSLWKSLGQSWTFHFYSNPPMDEYPRQTTSRKPFSKGLTKYEEVGGVGVGGRGKLFSKGSNKKVRWYIHAYIHVSSLESYAINSISTISK